MSYKQEKGTNDIVINSANVWYNLFMKNIKGFEGLYAITNDGKVWAFPRFRHHKSKKGLNFDVLYKGKWLANKINKRDGYVYIILSNKENKAITRKVHRLVALTYIPNYKNLREVNHINGIKTDNRVENLEWCSRQENATHASKNNLMLKGENHPNCTLSDIQISEIRKIALEKKFSQSKIGKIFGVNQSTIWKIIHNQRRKEYGVSH